jgi:hypothetical protein
MFNFKCGIKSKNNVAGNNYSSNTDQKREKKIAKEKLT